MKTSKIMAIGGLGLLTTAISALAMSGTASASPVSYVDPVQHALAVAGARLVQGGAGKITYPPTWAPAARIDVQMELFSGHGTTFTLENFPTASLAHQEYNSLMGYMAAPGQQPTSDQVPFQGAAQLGTFILTVKQPNEMCYWLDRAVFVAHLPRASERNGDC